MMIVPRRVYGDGEFFLAESPEARGHLQQLCEGRLIARCVWFHADDLPSGSAGFGLEFAGSGPVNRNYRDLGQGGERLVVIAMPVMEGRWLSRLIWRWIPAQNLWTRSMRSHFGTDRKTAGEDEADRLQRQIEGQMIRGVYAPKHHVGLGERLDFELTDASTLSAEAIPTGLVNERGRLTTCDLEVWREDPKQRTYVDMGESG